MNLPGAGILAVCPLAEFISMVLGMELGLSYTLDKYSGPWTSIYITEPSSMLTFSTGINVSSND